MPLKEIKREIYDNPRLLVPSKDDVLFIRAGRETLLGILNKYLSETCTNSTENGTRKETIYEIPSIPGGRLTLTEDKARAVLEYLADVPAEELGPIRRILEETGLKRNPHIIV